MNNYTDIAQYALIDKHDNVVSPTYWRCYGFDENDRAVVAVNDNSAKPKGVRFIGDGNFGRWGLIDRKFSYVIEPKYAAVGCVGSGLYFAWSLTEEPSEVLDANGTTVFQLPPGYNHVDPIPGGLLLVTAPYMKSTEMLPPLVLKASGQKVAELPNHAQILKLTEHRIIGVVRSPGFNVGADVFFADLSGKVEKTVHCQGADAAQNFQQQVAVLSMTSTKFGVIDEFGEWIIAPEEASFKVAERDRFVKTVHQTKFDSDACKAYQGSLGAQLQFLLQDYDLIGMNRSTLIDLIGPPEREYALMGGESAIVYTLSGFGAPCGNAYSYLEIKFKDDRVCGWRESNSGNIGGAWIEQNTKGVPTNKDIGSATP